MFLCNQFHCKFVCFTLEDNRSVSTSLSCAHSGDKPNAFQVMMSAAHKTVLPRPYDEQPLRGDHAIYNKLLELLNSRNLGWSPGIVETTSIKFLKALTDCLWMLDPHHDQFSSRAYIIPEVFSGFTN